jgi:predicted ribonuclease toxin of YeeF-YezG toxin-antitoxin module
VGVRDQVWDDAVKNSPDGLVRDPLTNRVMLKDEPWDMGHLSGHEFRRIQADAQAAGLTREQFLNIHNDPKIYRPELPSSNRSHALEDMSDLF